jgi:hypothetical protein
MHTRPAALRPVSAVVLVAALLVGCASDGRPGTSPAPPDVPAPVARSRDGDFELVVRAERGTYGVGEPIGVAATLRYLGPLPSVTVWGSGSGLVGFALEQVGGPLVMAPAFTADCAAHELRRDAPLQVAFRKSGGFSNDDPDAAFWKAFFADPLFRLPAGAWRVRAESSFALAPCGPGVPSATLRSEIRLEVVPPG